MRIQKPGHLGTGLKELRNRLGITIRDVEDQSQTIAEAQGNSEFSISNAWLTRIENGQGVPSIHKLFSLCTIYRVRLSDLLPMFGIDTNWLQKYEIEMPPAHTQILNLEPLDPARRVTFPVRFDAGFRPEETNLLSRMVQAWGEIPVALIQTFDIHRGLYGYIGLHDYTMYPLLRPGSFVFIDDHLPEILQESWKSELERPIYFFELRDGYACCWCEKKGEELLLIPHPLSNRPHRILPSNEVEVIGRVTAVAARIVGPGPAELSSRTHALPPKRP